MNHTRSHKAHRKSAKLIHMVSRREPKRGGRPLSDNGHGKRHLAEGMWLKPGGYGPLQELERRLEAMTPKEQP